jgi:hypothetical protein
LPKKALVADRLGSRHPPSEPDGRISRIRLSSQWFSGFSARLTIVTGDHDSPPQFGGQGQAVAPPDFCRPSKHPNGGTSKCTPGGSWVLGTSVQFPVSKCLSVLTLTPTWLANSFLFLRNCWSAFPLYWAIGPHQFPHRGWQPVIRHGYLSFSKFVSAGPRRADVFRSANSKPFLG